VQEATAPQQPNGEAHETRGRMWDGLQAHRETEVDCFQGVILTQPRDLALARRLTPIKKVEKAGHGSPA
jgi:hypothetical protein